MNRRYNRVVAQSVRLIPCLVCDLPVKPSHMTRHLRSEHNRDGKLCCVWCLKYTCHPPRKTKDHTEFIGDYVHRLRCFERRREEAAVSKRPVTRPRPMLDIREEQLLNKLKLLEREEQKHMQGKVHTDTEKSHTNHRGHTKHREEEHRLIANLVRINRALEQTMCSYDLFDSLQLRQETERLRFLCDEREKYNYLLKLDLVKKK